MLIVRIIARKWLRVESFPSYFMVQYYLTAMWNFSESTHKVDWSLKLSTLEAIDVAVSVPHIDLKFVSDSVYILYMAHTRCYHMKISHSLFFGPLKLIYIDEVTKEYNISPYKVLVGVPMSVGREDGERICQSTFNSNWFAPTF